MLDEMTVRPVLSVLKRASPVVARVLRRLAKI